MPALLHSCSPLTGAKRRAFLERVELTVQLGSWDWDPRKREALWSPGTFAIFGLQPDGRPRSEEYVFARTHEEDRARVRNVLTQMGRTAAPDGFEYRVLREDGRTRHVRLNLAAVERESDGTPARILGTIRDLTPQLWNERIFDARYAVSHVLEHWDTIELSGKSLLDELGEALGCDRACLLVPEHEELVPLLCRGADLTRRWQYPLPGDRTATRAMRCSHRARAERRPVAEQVGNGTVVSFPAMHRREVVAVIELHARETTVLDQRLTQLFVGLGYELGHFLARRRAEMAGPVLTPREREVLTLAADGTSLRDIATQLGISSATVRHHFQHIYARLGVSDRAGAVGAAMRAGLIT